MDILRYLQEDNSCIYTVSPEKKHLQEDSVRKTTHPHAPVGRIMVVLLFFGLVSGNIWISMQHYVLKSEVDVLKTQIAYLLSLKEVSNHVSFSTVDTETKQASEVSLGVSREKDPLIIQPKNTPITSDTTIEITPSDISDTVVSQNDTSSGLVKTSEDEKRKAAISLRFRRKAGRTERPRAASRGSRNDPTNFDRRDEPSRRKSRVKGSQLFHLSVDANLYKLDITAPGQILNMWTRRGSHDIDFGSYGNNGVFTISRQGLYFIYSQMTYYDNSGRWCHAIKRNSDIIAKCLASEWGMSIDPETDSYVPTVHNCYTATAVYLSRRDEISIISLYGRRTVHQGRDMSYWGIVKLG